MERLKLYILFLFIASYISKQSCAQNKKMDSLWSVYNNKNQVDTNRLKAIHAIAWDCRNNNPDTAIIIAEEELKLVATMSKNEDKAFSKKYEGRAFNTMGVA